MSTLSHVSTRHTISGWLAEQVATSSSNLGSILLQLKYIIEKFNPLIVSPWELTPSRWCVALTCFLKKEDMVRYFHLAVVGCWLCQQLVRSSISVVPIEVATMARNGSDRPQIVNESYSSHDSNAVCFVLCLTLAKKTFQSGLVAISFCCNPYMHSLFAHSWLSRGGWLFFEQKIYYCFVIWRFEYCNGKQRLMLCSTHQFNKPITWNMIVYDHTGKTSYSLLG